MPSLHDLKTAIIEIKESDIFSIIRGNSGGHFLSLRDKISFIISRADLVPLNELDDLPQSKIDRLYKSFSEILRSFEHAKQFEIDNNNPKDRLEQIKRSLEESYSRAYDCFIEIQSFVALKSSGNIRHRNDELLEEKIKQLDEKLNFANGSLEEIQDVASKAKQAEDAFSILRKASADAGITAEAIYFQKEAEIHGKAAGAWLVATAIILILLLFCIAMNPIISELSPLFELSTANPYKSITILASKALALAVITYCLFFATKNFHTHKHNAVVNRHRHNALCTYSAVVSATKDERHKDAVLNHAAACIYSPQDTGFTKLAKGNSLLEVMPKITVSPTT